MEKTATENTETILPPEDQSKSFPVRIHWLALSSINWEIAAYAAIFVLAFLLRFWDLGTRVLHHDESIHAVQSWRIYAGMGYAHDPVYHGQFLYYLNTIIYFLLGASDYTARVGPALAGLVVVGLPWLLRDKLGRYGALCASLLLAVSPSVLYYSRSLRHDMYAALGTMLLAVGIWRYLSNRRPRWLYLGVFGLALGFTNHELTYITLVMFGLFLALNVFAHYTDPNRPEGRLRDSSTLPPAAVYLLVIGTICAPLFSAGILVPKAISDPLSTLLGQNTLLGATFFIIAAIAVALGTWWNEKLWFGMAALFWAFFGLIYTGFLLDPLGFFSGAIGALQYWLSQHSYQRGAQPWYYYALLLPLYEFLPLLFAPFAVVFHFYRKNLFGIFLAYWSLVAFVAYSYAGEKMPWLVIHIAIPIILLSSSFLGWVADRTDVRQLWRQRAFELVLFAVIAIGALTSAFLISSQWRPLRTGEQSVVDFEKTILLVVMLGAAAAIGYRIYRSGLAVAAKVATLVVFAIMLAFTLRISLQANFKNTDTPVEMLIYTQSSPDIRSVMTEIDNIAFRAGQRREDLKIAYDSGVSWPFEWYLRDYKGKVFIGMDQPPQDAAVVLVGFEGDHDAKVRAQLGDRYVGQRYKLRWWFPEDYKSVPEWVNALQTEQGRQQLAQQNKRQDGGISDALEATVSETGRTKLLRYFVYREPLTPLGSTDFMFYVRKDLVNYGAALAPDVVNAAPVVDDYSGNTRPLTNVQIVGSRGSGAGQLFEPKAVALSPDSSLLVADNRNRRIAEFSTSGASIQNWGTAGDGEGQFNASWGPWGVATDRQGNVYVADLWNHRIEKFDADGKFLLQWGKQGNGPGDFFGPRGIAIDAAGNVYVTDTGNHRIQRFDAQGKFIDQVGSMGSQLGQFREPVGLGLDANGFVYVADTWNRRIQKFDRTLSPVGSWPVKGWAGESPTNKPYLTVDNRGHVFATDPDKGRVLEFTGSGELVAAWGKAGSDSSSLQFPSGLAVDSTGGIWVADSGNHRLLRFSPEE